MSFKLRKKEGANFVEYKVYTAGEVRRMINAGSTDDTVNKWDETKLTFDNIEETAQVNFDELDERLDTLNNIKLPLLQDKLDELNNVKLPQLQSELEDLNNVQLPALQNELNTLDGYIADPSTIPSNYTFFEGIVTNQAYIDSFVAKDGYIDQLVTNTTFANKFVGNEAFIETIVSTQVFADEIIANHGYIGEIISNEIWSDVVTSNEVFTGKLVANEVWSKFLASRAFVLLAPTEVDQIITDIETETGEPVTWNSPYEGGYIASSNFFYESSVGAGDQGVITNGQITDEGVFGFAIDYDGYAVFNDIFIRNGELVGGTWENPSFIFPYANFPKNNISQNVNLLTVNGSSVNEIEITDGAGNGQDIFLNGVSPLEVNGTRVGAKVTIRNSNSSATLPNLTIKHNNTNATTVNRIYTPDGGDLSLGVGEGVELFYRVDIDRWIVTNVAGSGGLVTESDPVYSGDPASSITQTNISNWNTAYAERGSQIAGTGLVYSGGDLNVSNVPNSSLQNSFIGINAGSGLTNGGNVSLGGSVTISHADTSTEGDSDNSADRVIQDIFLDGYGHVTNINTTDLDDRYFTKSDSDNRYLQSVGSEYARTNTNEDWGTNTIEAGGVGIGESADSTYPLVVRTNLGTGVGDRFHVRSNGNVQVPGDLFTQYSYAIDHQESSDVRVKKIINEGDGLEFVDTMRLTKFRKDGAEIDQWGLIAQDVYKADKGLVGHIEHSELGEIMTLSPLTIASVAVDAVRRLKEKVKLLEMQINGDTK